MVARRDKLMMLINSSRNRKLIFGLMFAMIGIRLLIFALATFGAITWAPPLGASILSWIMPVGMPLVMISFMLLYGRKRMMPRQMKHEPDDAPLLDILQRRFALGQITKEQYEEMKVILKRTSHKP
jgi:uncharacterized membrane protein